jgi:acyl-coenzyme A thioesterase PaaI-like protein
VHDDAFYLPTGPDRFQATVATQGPWDPGYQHGGPPTALLAAAVESHTGAAGMRIARMTAEFLRPVPVGEVTVRVTVLRPGRRVQLVEADLLHEGAVVITARAWQHAVDTGALPPATTTEPAPPVPDAGGSTATWDRFGYGRALEWRPTAGDPGSGKGPAAVWARLRVPLVAGRDTAGLDRLLVLADSANGVSLELPMTEWLSMPTALTVTVLRPPTDEWVHLDARTHLAGDGVGLSHGQLSDSGGLVAVATQPLHVAHTGPHD